MSLVDACARCGLSTAATTAQNGACSRHCLCHCRRVRWGTLHRFASSGPSARLLAGLGRPQQARVCNACTSRWQWLCGPGWRPSHPYASLEIPSPPLLAFSQLRAGVALVRGLFCHFAYQAMHTSVHIYRYPHEGALTCRCAALLEGNPTVLQAVHWIRCRVCACVYACMRGCYITVSPRRVVYPRPHSLPACMHACTPHETSRLLRVTRLPLPRRFPSLLSFASSLSSHVHARSLHANQLSIHSCIR